MAGEHPYNIELIGAFFNRSDQVTWDKGLIKGLAYHLEIWDLIAIGWCRIGLSKLFNNYFILLGSVDFHSIALQDCYIRS